MGPFECGYMGHRPKKLSCCVCLEHRLYTGRKAGLWAQKIHVTHEGAESILQKRGMNWKLQKSPFKNTACSFIHLFYYFSRLISFCANLYSFLPLINTGLVCSCFTSLRCRVRLFVSFFKLHLLRNKLFSLLLMYTNYEISNSTH